MSENKRPQGRKRGETTSSGGVHKRGDGLNTGKVGNAGYSGRGKSSAPSGGSGIKRAGGIGGLAIAAFLLMQLLGGGGSGGTASQATPTPTPKPQQQQTTPVQPSGNNNSQNTGTSGHFTAPVTTYTDTNTAAVSETVSSGAREKFTKLRGSGQDTVTILVYMCATDLESNYGMATSDINEMVSAAQSDKVNVIVETGGTKRWQNNVMSTATNERWKIASNSLIALDRNVGRKQMTATQTLQDFISFGVTNFPADRYMLIFWDHGGGSIQGYGYDQVYPNDTMTVDEISSVLKNSGVKFDVVGFDACLMANVETAYAVSPYADYMIASEETEPGTGWYYTNWLNMLANNSSTPTTTIGKQIVDDFITRSTNRELTSLSVIDLAEFEAQVPSALNAFAKTITNSVKSEGYRQIANARSVTKEFAQSNKIDQIDLVHFCENVNSAEAKTLISAVKNCVKYNRIKNMTNASGLSIYFPYRSTSKVATAARLYSNLGMSSDYTDAIRSFATLESSGQMVTYNNSNPIYSILGGQPVSSGQQIYSSGDILNLLMGSGASQSSSPYGSLNSLLGGSAGVDNSSLDLFSQLLGARAMVDTDELILSEKNGTQVLSLSQEQWDLINAVGLNVWADDGNGYIDLGVDDIFEFDDDGDLLMEYDGKWTCLDDQLVSYYVLSEEFYSDDSYNIKGYVPAFVTTTYTDQETGETETETVQVKFIVEFTEDAPDGVVLGAQKVYDDGMEAKGYVELHEGDTIEFICDYYDYDGNYQNSYYLGEPLAFDGELNVGVYQITDTPLKYGYRLTDIYNAETWTPMLDY